MGWRTSSKLWRKLRPFATEMRREPTKAEAWLWESLRRKQVLKLQFRHQWPIEQYVVDFVCPRVRVIVEVDGPIHDHRRKADAVRQQHLESLGYQVLRFRNEQVLKNRATVVKEIARILQARLENPK